MIDRDEMLESLMIVAPSILGRVFAPSHCIAATKIGIEVLAYFGVQARPIPVIVQVFNQKFCVLSKAGVTDPIKLIEAGAYVVEIDKGNHVGGYGGHLMIEVDDGVVDLNFGQFCRPHKEIHVPAALAFARLDNDKTNLFEVNECAITIRRIDDKFFRRTPDWKKAHRDITGAIIRAIKERLY